MAAMSPSRDDVLTMPCAVILTAMPDCVIRGYDERGVLNNVTTMMIFVMMPSVISNILNHDGDGRRTRACSRLIARVVTVVQ